MWSHRVPLISRRRVNQTCRQLTEQNLPPCLSEKMYSMQDFIVCLSWAACFCLKSEQLCASSAATAWKCSMRAGKPQQATWPGFLGSLNGFDWIILTGLHAKTFNTVSLRSALHYLWSQYPTETSNSAAHEQPNFLYAPNGKQFNTALTEGIMIWHITWLQVYRISVCDG